MRLEQPNLIYISTIARSSAVYGAFLFVGAFALGAVRAYLPNLTILAIFGSIVLDVVSTSSCMSAGINYFIYVI